MQLNRQIYHRPVQRTAQTDDHTPVMAYVPVQVFTGTYEPYQGFGVGTMFPDLNKPFMRGGCMG